MSRVTIAGVVSAVVFVGALATAWIIILTGGT